ncbi:hypothetical protein GYMLUDRAFT_182038 [Collybiopsis luxurians FD-317 M1]|uniref:Uncharacterized protein n=1 Tax=Collybiopsis luxurians FD-317 M1 TaxID=944289 RepID=A0A0D0BN81_9AGAR|nr:hypothetical protein GYMLUDRAFT_182038 [Collybiopsis luxurians FD-317 M1]
MGYFGERLEELVRRDERGEAIEEFDDLCCGRDILTAAKEGRINRNDTFLMISFDGVQLYEKKQSDCWIFIWILLGLSPNCRYKKKYVVPGPNPPKITQSFLFPALAHVESLNKAGGLHIWNAQSNIIYSSKIFIALAVADSLGLVHFSGGVGHSGKHGCQLWCGQPGLHKEGEATYFLVMFKLDGYMPCRHRTYEVLKMGQYSMDSECYIEDLRCVMLSHNATDYSENRKETGIKVPSLFLGMHPDTILGLPNMFPCDIMHLVLNLADLITPLLQGSLKLCNKDDDVSTWVWAVLKDNDTWTQHGADVANATKYLPGSFDRPPCNPAKKINSGYKAWEYLLYLFGLAPGLLYGVLPLEYGKSFCRLPAAIH